jgi:MtrB/PioB family decaheme-associated outer membrane protein
MKRQTGFVAKLAVSALLCGVAWAVPGLHGQAVAAEPVPYWWFSGSVELGGRFFLNHPQDHLQTSAGPPGTPGVVGKSLAGYYQYSDIRPGVFGNVWLSAGTRDGLYQFDFGGKNIGYDDQSYFFDFSKAGEIYFSAGWDQSPHTYSRSAFSPYVVNGNTVTINPCAVGNATAALQAPCAQPIDLGIKRDTASAKARWTPDDAWDIKADYSHMARTGTQVSAFTGGVSPTTQFPKPVDDVTQNYGVNAEHAGLSPWGQRLVMRLGYVGSTYTDNFNSFTVMGENTAQSARDAAWPSNNANGFSGTLAADLPWKSRYVGNVSYTMMRQNAAFIPTNTDPTKILPLPASSLNGAINTLTINNQLTTKITSDLSSKLTYRYYDFQNDTPELYFPNNYNRDYSSSNDSVNSLSMAYTKQNFGAALNWRPNKEWNLGAAYGYELYNWTRADVDGTSENTGKVYGDWKPNSWLTVRASGYYGVRRSSNYDYLGHVGNFQWCSSGTCDGSELYNTTYRQLMISDRDTYKAVLGMDIVPMQSIMISPMVKYQEMKYGVDPATQQGLQDSRKWSVGSDLTYMLSRDASIMFGYMYEWGSQLLFGTTCTVGSSGTPNPCTGAGAFQTLTNDTTTVHTFTTALRVDVIPDKLNTELRYTLSHGVNNMNMFMNGNPPFSGRGTPCTTAPLPCGGTQFPQDRTWFQRLDATATYKFDKEQVAAMGWKGDVKFKLHYAWERNAADNWANDPLTPYTLASSSTLWLGWYNPNYNVHLLSASIVASW